MAPKKRMHTGAGATAGKPARVTCPACQKEVPSFFVNSHLDLECPVLKSTSGSSRPSLSPTSALLKFGSPQPLLDLVQAGALRIDERISKASVEDQPNVVTSWSEFDERRAGKLQRFEADEDITRGQPNNKKCAFLDEECEDDGGAYAQDTQFVREVPTEYLLCMSSFRDTQPGNNEKGHDSGKSHFQSTGILSPCSTTQSVHQSKYGGGGASDWLGTASYISSIPHSFPSSSLLKLNAPKGLQLLEDFITAEEEEQLLHCLDTDMSNPWKLSRVNGIHQGKSYGNHIFGDSKRRVVSQAIVPMPNFVLPYIERMRNQLPVLKNFFPNEMNSIDYRKGDGHYLKAHMDDRQLSGTVLVNLSLAGGCFMMYTRERGPQEAFRVKLLPRSLQVLTGESRYNYKHGIQKNDIVDPRRVSMTFRQSIETSKTISSSR